MPDPVVTPPVVTPPVVTPPAAWYAGATGVDDAMVGHIKNRGMDGKTAAEAAIHFAQAHIQAEKLIGVPADQMVRLPKDAADEAGTALMWSKLGKPSAASGYDLSGVKFKDGTALDASFVEFFQAEAHKLHLPQAQAQGMAAAFVSHLEASTTVDANEQAGKLAMEKTELAKNWGPNYEANMFVAKQAAKALGVSPEAVSVLENLNGMGYAKVMEMFRGIGVKIGEDRYVNSPAGGAGAMTRDQAVAQKQTLMRDRGWVDSYLNGDAAKQREMTALNTLIANASINSR